MEELDAFWERKLRSMIDGYLAGNTDYGEFARVFYDAYIEDMPDDCLPDEAQRLFFSTVQELIDWTDHAPDHESRADGWIDEPTYRARAVELREAYRTRFGL